MKSSKMANNIFKLQIERNLMAFIFCCKSLSWTIEWWQPFLWYLVMADIQNDWQHYKWSKMPTKSPFHSSTGILHFSMFSDVQFNFNLHRSGGAAWWTIEEENDRISTKKTNYIKSTLLYFLKVCLYSCYTNYEFYRISPFCQLNIVFL